MAKILNKGLKPSIRNRGEDIGEPRGGPYQYQPFGTEEAYSTQERAIRRHEVRNVYDQMYRNGERRDQRAFQRIRDMENEFYAGVDPRRRQEIADAGIIREDLNCMANLPRQAIHHEYPQAGYYSTPYIDDTRRGLDTERDDDGTINF
jgi:hypothetical protein